MEFGQKLQELRKSKGLTQEELAEQLYVSRTAVSKWESGRGYPSIDSLKEISKYFSITIDDLLSGEKLISLAEKENKDNIRSICDSLFAIMDLLAVMLFFLPLYPKRVGDYIYSVNFFAYTDTTTLNHTIYLVLFLGLILVGILKILMMQIKPKDQQKKLTILSWIIHIVTILFLALVGETYAVMVAFLLLTVKGIVFMRYIKISG